MSCAKLEDSGSNLDFENGEDDKFEAEGNDLVTNISMLKKQVSKNAWRIFLAIEKQIIDSTILETEEMRVEMGEQKGNKNLLTIKDV